MATDQNNDLSPRTTILKRTKRVESKSVLNSTGVLTLMGVSLVICGTLFSTVFGGRFPAFIFLLGIAVFSAGIIYNTYSIIVGILRQGNKS